MDYNLVILRILFLIILNKTMAFGFVGQESRKCKYLRVDKLLKIRCYDMNLKDVPQYLSTSVEVLDLSFNRIKKLKKTSFQPYKQTKYLLLYENMIQSVEPGTFSYLTSLQEIDLSNNALMTIPLEIFHLPLIRNLYIDSNDLTILSKDLENLETPIKAPLEYLNIADCGLTDIPNLGILPKLWHMNVSSNPLTTIPFDNFARMCNLKSIDLTKTQLTNCACQQVNTYLRHFGVQTKFVPQCPVLKDSNDCSLVFNWTIESKDFQKCQTAISAAEVKSIWLIVLWCLGGLILLLLGSFYFVHWQSVRRKNQKIKKISVFSPPNATKQHQHEQLLLQRTTV